MNLRVRLPLVFLWSLVVAGLSPVSAQEASVLRPAHSVVKASAYVSIEPVPRDRAFQVAVVAEILPGFHINANKVLDDYLIPTRVEAGPPPPAGLRLLETVYPPGQLEKFEFSDKLLLVYEGTVTVWMKLNAAPGTPLGVLHLPLTLRYQACNDKTCLPPAKLPVAVELEIAPAGAKARAVYPQIFRKSGSRTTGHAHVQ